MTIEIPDIVADPKAFLTGNEAEALRIFFASPEFAKLQAIIAVRRPSANCEGTRAYDQDAFSSNRALVRISEMRGWDLYRAAIEVTLNPPQKRERVEENFQPLTPDGPH